MRKILIYFMGVLEVKKIKRILSMGVVCLASVMSMSNVFAMKPGQKMGQTGSAEQRASVDVTEKDKARVQLEPPKREGNFDQHTEGLNGVRVEHLKKEGTLESREHREPSDSEAKGEEVSKRIGEASGTLEGDEEFQLYMALGYCYYLL